MFEIPFRKYDIQIRSEGESNFIFDPVRRKDVILTPEEWVRQNILHYLIEDLNYPRNKIAVEKEFAVNKRKKRFDILVYDRSFKPFLLVECKAPEILIGRSTLNQIVDYNLEFKSKYLLVSNGNNSWCFFYEKGEVKEKGSVPEYQ